MKYSIQVPRDALEKSRVRAELAAEWVTPLEPHLGARVGLPFAYIRQFISHEIWRRHWQDSAAGIMVHINKTAGTSASAALRQPAVKHMNATMIRSLVGDDVWRQKFSFAVIRNPYERVISDYNYRLKKGFTGLDARRPVPFEEWFDLAYVQKAPPYHFRPHMFTDQYSWISSRDGDVIVDYVGRFEKLDQDWTEIASVIGIPTTLEHRNAQSKSFRAQALSADISEKITQVFARDFELFGYPKEPHRSSEPPARVSGGVVHSAQLAS